MHFTQLLNFLSAAWRIAAEQVPALLVSFSVAQVYFRRQREIDKSKEESDVTLHYRKLVNAYITYLGKYPKIPFYLREAMSDLEIRIKIYRPEWNSDKLLMEAGEAAKNFIAANPDDFENICTNSQT